MSLVNKVKKTIIDNNLFKKGDNVIVALSGGSDSVCLFYALKKLENELSFSLFACHLNHMIRGEDTTRDEKFVKDLCSKNKVKLFLKRQDILSLAKKEKKSVELCAREKRYEFFDEVLNKIPNSYIATAHNLNDTIETTMINFSRACGLKGLSGVPIKRQRIIRPLLNCQKNEIYAFLNENYYTFVFDKTNDDKEILRNFIRHDIIKPLENRKDISFLNNASQTIENIKTDNSFIEEFTLDFYNKNVVGGEIEKQKLLNLHKAISFRLLNKMLFDKFNINLSKKNFEIILKMLTRQKSCAREQITNNIYAVISYDRFSFENFLQDKILKTKLDLGDNFINNKIISLNFHKEFTKNLIDCDKIDGNLYVRSKKTGDFFIHPKKSVKKSLKKMFIDDKIPRHLRNNLMVICDDKDNIIFVEGYGISKQFLADENTKKMIAICVKLGE